MKSKTKEISTMKKNLGALVILLLSIIMVLTKPFGNSLDSQGYLTLCAIFVTLGIWIFKPFNLPFGAGSLFFGAFLLIIKIPAATVFSGFTQTAIWTLISALFFGYVLQKTGLGHRIALLILKLFKPTYITLMLSWVIIGLILSVLTPSMTVRVAIIMPLATNCCQICKLKGGTSGNSLIMLTAFAMATVPGCGWINGTLTGPILQGSFSSAGIGDLLTFDSYLSVSLLPVAITTILMLVLAYFALKPSDTLSEDAINAIRETKLAPMTRNELLSAIILTLSFIMFLTEKYHHIPSAAVCMSATFLFFATGVLCQKEIASGISWDLVLFLGMALGLGAICEKTGISALLISAVVPALSPIVSNKFIFFGIISLICFLWHFVDIASYVPTLAIVPPMLPAIEQAYGISPLVFVPILAMACSAFFMGYMNPAILMGQSISKEQSWTAKHLLIYGSIYCICAIISILITVPYWANLGLI